MLQFKLGRKRVLDTHLAAILYSNGVTRLLTSNAADFVAFKVLEPVMPSSLARTVVTTITMCLVRSELSNLNLPSAEPHKGHVTAL
jgi:hypothetical protein